MPTSMKRSVLAPLSRFLPEVAASAITRRCSRRLVDELTGELTDEFLELLLKGMDLAFCLSGSYRENIRDFKGRYLFRTEDGGVGASAVFGEGRMEIREEAIPDWTVRVTFRDPVALRTFLFSRNQDILNSLLKNDVDVDGNLNYLFRFGFLARDLLRRLGVEQ
jgi:hypothetical protein